MGDTRVGALAGLHVLVVEDNRDARQILSMLLSYFGALVSPVITARDALDFLRQTKPDVVVADFMLPDHDASWLLRSARRRGLAVPFIVVSSADLDREHLAQLGAEAFLPKPIDHTQLIDTILAVVRR